MGDVRLVDLDIIKRYSLAVRQEAAPAEDLLAVLDASREMVLAAMGGTARDGDAGETKPTSGGKGAAAGRARKPAKPRETVA